MDEISYSSKYFIKACVNICISFFHISNTGIPEEKCNPSIETNSNAQCVLYEKSNCNGKDGRIELGSGDYQSIYSGFRNNKIIGTVFVKIGCQLTVWKGKIIRYLV